MYTGWSRKRIPVFILRSQFENTFLTFFLKIQKTRLFTFFEVAFQKNVKKNVIHNSRFQTLLTFQQAYMESPYSSKAMYVYNIYGISSCVKDNKSDSVWYLGLKFQAYNTCYQFYVFYVFYVFFENPKKPDFLRFLLCFTRFLELCLQ